MDSSFHHFLFEDGFATSHSISNLDTEASRSLQLTRLSELSRPQHIESIYSPFTIPISSTSEIQLQLFEAPVKGWCAQLNARVTRLPRRGDLQPRFIISSQTCSQYLCFILSQLPDIWTVRLPTLPNLRCDDIRLQIADHWSSARRASGPSLLNFLCTATKNVIYLATSLDL